MIKTLGLLLAATAPLPFSPASNATSAARACNSIQALLGLSFVQSSGPEYEAGATGAWNFFNREDQPTCIVFPRNASDVQIAMREIFRAQADYAVQAGGHSAMPEWNTIENGVLILFSHMSNVSYNTEDDTITLQPGVRWGDAVTALAPQGVAPVGGRVPDVGTGLLLGGGLSYLSPQYGFAADMLKEVDVVLVNGDLVTASANEHADLFRALKGGANRFGIATRYEVYAVHTGTADDKTWFGGAIEFSNSSAEALAVATAHYVRDVQDPKAVILMVFSNSFSAGVITPLHLLVLFYEGTSLPMDIFGEFLSIPATSTTLGPMSFSDVQNVLAADVNGNGQIFGASALVGDEQLFLDALTHWTNFSLAFKDNPALSTVILAFTPIPQSQIDAGRAKGGNAIDPPDGAYAAVQMEKTFFPGVTRVPEDVEQGGQLLFQQIPASPGKPLYINECDETQKVLETYGGYEFLKTVYAKYDPHRFNVNHSKGPIGL